MCVGSGGSSSFMQTVRVFLVVVKSSGSRIE